MDGVVWSARSQLVSFKPLFRQKQFAVVRGTIWGDRHRLLQQARKWLSRDPLRLFAKNVFAILAFTLPALERAIRYLPKKIHFSCVYTEVSEMLASGLPRSLQSRGYGTPTHETHLSLGLADLVS